MHTSAGLLLISFLNHHKFSAISIVEKKTCALTTTVSLTTWSLDNPLSLYLNKRLDFMSKQIKVKWSTEWRSCTMRVVLCATATFQLFSLCTSNVVCCWARSLHSSILLDLYITARYTLVFPVWLIMNWLQMYTITQGVKNIMGLHAKWVHHDKC